MASTASKTGAASQREPDTSTPHSRVAEELIQVRGFNAFSYADIAAQLEITKASLHYHFASKAQLGRGADRRYAQRFGELLGGSTREPPAPRTSSGPMRVCTPTC